MTLVFLHVPNFAHALSCAVCQVPGGPAASHVCSACKSARYCGVECQRKDWKAHKPTCKKIAGFAVRKVAVVVADKTIKPYDKKSTEQFRAVGALRDIQPEGAVIISWLSGSSYGHYLDSDAPAAHIDKDGVFHSDSGPLLPGHRKDAVLTTGGTLNYHIYTRKEFSGNGWVADDVKAAVDLFFSQVGNGCAWVNFLPDQLQSVWFGTFEN